MRSNTQAITIATQPDKVLRFLADPLNLPRWAVGFARGVREAGPGWVVSTGGGEVELRMVTDERLGVVDFVLLPAPGVEGRAASRVLANGDGCEYVFTQFQAAGMPDDVFAKNVRAVAHELSVLKALMEVECPL
jgi:hypothetical protein